MQKYNVISFALLTVISIVLTSCASVGKPTYFYDEVTMRNKSTSNVHDVKIKVEKTGLVFLCSFIPPKGECSNKFKKRKYLGNPITLSWQYNNGVKSTKVVRLKLPEKASTTKTLKGMLEVDYYGMIHPYLYQE